MSTGSECEGVDGVVEHGEGPVALGRDAGSAVVGQRLLDELSMPLEKLGELAVTDGRRQPRRTLDIAEAKGADEPGPRCAAPILPVDRRPHLTDPIGVRQARDAGTGWLLRGPLASSFDRKVAKVRDRSS